MLRVDNLTVRYGEMEAVRGVSFEVATGEAVAIIGANGAGKSSTLKALMGLVPARGHVQLDGRSLEHLPPWQRAAAGMAWVPEGRRVFGDLTVEDNLRVGGHRLGAASAKTESERVYALFPRLAERRGQPARTLSGGEQQMLAIGRALMGRPRVVLVDEASLGLAPLFVARVFEAIAALVAGGMTVLLVEQNVRQALAVVQRAYLLEVGRVVTAGTAAELTADPTIRAAYLGA